MIKKIIKGLILIFLIFILVVGGYLGKVYFDYRHLINQRPLEQVVLKARQKKYFTKLEDVSKDFINPLIASEDRRFYTRTGIDFRSLARAIFTNIKQGELVQGGSTIPQQVAKILYFDHEQTLQDKVIQMYLMYDLESKYSKDEILELYINNLYYGAGYYSIAEASQGYFGIKPGEINLAQGSLLTALIPAPTAYNLKTHFDRAKAHQKRVLFDMVEVRTLDEKDVERIYRYPVIIKSK